MAALIGSTKVRSRPLSHALSTAGCPAPRSQAVANCFDGRVLAKLAEDTLVGLIVFRGDPVDVVGFDCVHSYRELAAVFAASDSGHDDIPLERLLALLRGDTASGTARILRHAGLLSRLSWQCALSRLTGDDAGVAPHASFADYVSLAHACARDPKAIAIGLRGPDAVRLELKTVAVGGVPALESCADRYPLQYPVQLFLRRSQPELQRLQCFAHIEAVSRRIDEDQAIAGAAGLQPVCAVTA